jgi:glycosyltransferase involved in cell wall biosynthesis
MDAQLYIAHNLAALPAAMAAAKIRSSFLAFDAEDFHSGELVPGAGTETERRVRLRLEQACLPECSYVTAASPLIGEAYARFVTEPPRTLLNVFPLAEAPGAPVDSPSDRSGPGPSLYWFSQTVGGGRGLENAIAALGRMKVEARLHLRGEVSDSYRQELLRFARDHGVADRVHFLPSAMPDEMVRLAACHDVGLSLEVPDSENRDRCLTNKIFCYLLAGIPQILSPTRAQAALAPELGEAARLLATADPDEMARKCDALLLDAESTRAARQHAWALGRYRFNWDREKRSLMEVVDPVLARA